VTVATNMAGRGVDIKLGGDVSAATGGVEGREAERQKILELGGLHVTGTERHESRRIDNQLRGRAGRQGDLGSSHFFVSLEDDLMRVFGGDQVRALMDRFGMEEDTPLEHTMVSRSIAQAQKRVEGFNFDIRKRLVEYDDVANAQREIIYGLRRQILEGAEELAFLLEKLVSYEPEIAGVWHKRQGELGEVWPRVVRDVSLGVVDVLWMEHIDTLTDLREGIGLRGHAQRDPLIEYKKEAYELFERLVAEIYGGTAERLLRIEVRGPGELPRESVPRRLVLRHESPELGVADEAQQVAEPITRGRKVGRNDPCPCGSGKKYKRCCGR